MKKKPLIRVDNVFRQELNRIKLEKIRNGTSNRMLSDRRLTKAMRKTNMWKDMKQVLLDSDIGDDWHENE